MGETVSKAFCDERSGNIRESVQAIQRAQGEAFDKLENTMEQFKKDCISMMQAASNGEPIKVENRWSTKDKLAVIGAILGSPVLVAGIEALIKVLTSS